MSKAFRIADFLIVDGDELEVDIANRLVTGFSRATFKEGGVTVEFDASPAAEPPKPGVPDKSTITWGEDDATTISGGIDLKKNKVAFLSFHWANPLTPRSAGLFFRLGIEHNKDGYRLRFHRADTGPENGRRLGYAYFQTRKDDWDFFFLVDDARLWTLTDWRNFWVNRVVSQVSAKPIQEGALFTGQAALVDGKPDKNNWTFGWRFSTGTDLISRAVAAVDIEDEWLAVNARALRLEERPELRPRPLHWDRKLSLRCASVRSADGPSNKWIVDWLGVPTFEETAEDKRKDHFSLRAFWQELARHWALGLRSLRSRNALTFVPTDIDAPTASDGKAPWIFRFLCAPDETELAVTWRSELATIGRGGMTKLRFELGSLVSTSGAVCTFDADASAQSSQKAFQAITQVDDAGLASLLDLDIKPSTGTLGTFLVGGLVLEVGAVQSGELLIGWAPVRTQLGQPPVTMRLDLKAAGGVPRPGTEDPERGFESENDLLKRERPLVVDLTPTSTQKTTIRILEEADGGRSRVLEVLVRNAVAQSTAGAADVVVIDPAPMLVARVHTTGTTVNPDAILASYRDDGERPAGWELHTETGAMTLILPPQAIGEEMIKGILEVEHLTTRKPVPFVDRPFDFRLSPPARLTLDRTDIDTARAAAPWALRRLLDRREAVVGLKLDAARFELLYGLRATIEQIEGLRVAEQDAFVGRIPIAPAIRDRAQGRLSDEVLFLKPELDYANNAVKWIRGLFARPAQLPVFRNFAKRERVVLREGVTFDFRPTRQTAHPLRVDEPSKSSVSKPAEDFVDGRLPLRGGVDYPFESENIYNIVLENEQKSSPGEPQGHVSGLVFGTLGGSGSQQASFDEGRSIIITETAQGRLSSLTLIRVGRIAMLWHHARHVIVYERATRTMPRYRHDQPNDFEGLAALRKVKEYIEITQPRRTYPDFAAGVEERPAAGPLTGCTYETVVIPVKSSWGHDIEEGWVMALRGPLLTHELPFYPMPKIFAELARAEAKGSGAINHLASDPSQLLFFTTTRKGLGADTDRWPAWPDIDFPLTRRPVAPKVRFLPGFSGANHQPDAAPHDYGQRRFTIDLDPPEEAANLLYGRPGNGLEARVRNVSILRGGAPRSARSAVDEAVGETFAEAESRIGDGLAELAQHLERIAQRGASATVGEVAGLRDEARAVLNDARSEAKRVLDAVSAADGLITKGAEKWDILQANALATAEKESARLRGELQARFSGNITEIANRLEATGTSALAEAETSLRAASDSVCRQMIERLESVPFLAAEVRDRLTAELQNAQKEIDGVMDELKSAWHAEVDAVIARLPTESASALEAELFEVVLEGRSRIAAFGAGFGRTIKTRLGPLFGDIAGDNGAVGRLTAIVENAVQNLTEGIDETPDIIPPFEVVAPDREALKKLLDSVFPEIKVPFEDLLKELLTPLQGPVDEWLEQIKQQTDAIRALCASQTAKLLEKVREGHQALRDAADAIVKNWNDTVAKSLKTLSDEATKRFKSFLLLPEAVRIQGFIHRLNFLKNEVSGAIDALQAGLDDAARSVRDLADQAQAVAERAGAGLRRIGEQVEQAVATELRNLVQGAQGAALELTRALAEGPITDTMRCTRDWLGYYYEQARDTLDVTRAASVFNDLGGSVLNSLAAQVPFDRIRDRVMAQLGNFDVNKLFPDFAGLKLEHLLGGMKIPSDPDGEYDWIKMRHGFDRARLTAWSEVTIDKLFEDSPELFTLPPVSLSVVQPRFTASSRIEADVNGVRAQRTQALLVADWTVTLNGQLIMSIEKGGLYFDGDGGFRFDFEANNLQLAPALAFITDALKSLLPPDEGLTLTPLLPGGISVELSLPLPDIGTGAFTLTGITLYTHFDLLVAGGFEVRTGAWLSRPERPFGMAVLFLGGGGWFGVDVRYKPPQEFETRVSLGLAAGAFVALNFGVARGSAGVLFTVGLDFYRNWLKSGSQELSISIGILVWGEFNILGIVSAYLRVVLRIEYRNGEMTGYGSVSVSIKICWCFTLRVNSQVRLPFKGSKKAARSTPTPEAVAELAAPSEGASELAPPDAPEYGREALAELATENVTTLMPATIAQAIDAHFKNLDV